MVLNHKINIEFHGIALSPHGNKVYTNTELTEYYFVENTYFTNKLIKLASEHFADSELITFEMIIKDMVKDFHDRNRSYFFTKYEKTIIKEENKFKIIGISNCLSRIDFIKDYNNAGSLFTLSIHELVGCSMFGYIPFTCNLCEFVYTGLFKHKICGDCKRNRKDKKKGVIPNNK